MLVRDVVAGRGGLGFTLQIALWLWFTVLFANFAEAMAEGRGKAQADSLRDSAQADARPSACAIPTDQRSTSSSVFADELRQGDLVLVAGRAT